MGISLNLLSNALYLFAARIINPASTIILGFLIAKEQGVGTFGRFSFILSFFFLASVVASLGISTLITRETAKNPELRNIYFANSAIIGIIASGLGLVLIILIGYFYNLGYDGRYALLILSFSIFPAVQIFYWEAFLITFEKNLLIIPVQAIEAVVKVTLGLMIITKGMGLVALMAVFLGSRYLSAGLYLLVIRKVFAPLRFDLRLDYIKHILSLMPTFAGLYIFSVLFSKLDMMMLALLKDYNDVGLYSAAYKLLEISFFFPTCLVAVFFPILAQTAESSPAKFKRLMTSGIAISTFMFMPLVVAFLVWAKPIIFTVYSPEFNGSVLTFRILILTLCFYMADQIYAHSLVAFNFQKYNLQALFAATCVNFILNISLIPKFSYVGASTATLLSMVFLVGLHFYFVKKYVVRLLPG